MIKVPSQPKTLTLRVQVPATLLAPTPPPCQFIPASEAPLEVMSAEELHSEFGQEFILVESKKELHHTPFNTVQSFVYCHFRR